MLKFEPGFSGSLWKLLDLILSNNRAPVSLFIFPSEILIHVNESLNQVCQTISYFPNDSHFLDTQQHVSEDVNHLGFFHVYWILGPYSLSFSSWFLTLSCFSFFDLFLFTYSFLILWVFICCTPRFSLVAVSKGAPPCEFSLWPLGYTGFSSCGLWA